MRERTAMKVARCVPGRGEGGTTLSLFDVGADPDRIVAEVERGGGRHSARFGDGHAAESIAAIITEYEP